MATCLPLPFHDKIKTLATIFFRHYQPWTFLLALDEDNKIFDERATDATISARTAWQHNFTLLKTFVLDLQLSGKYALDHRTRLGFQSGALNWYSACICRIQDEAGQILACGKTGVKTKKVWVTVTVEGCRTGACGVRLAGLLQTILCDDKMDLDV